MPPVNASVVRLPATLLLLGLLAVSILCLKNIVTAAWSNDQQEEARYLRAPNCFPTREASEVDNTLPACQFSSETVVAKLQTTTIHHRRSGDYPSTDRRLALRDGNGNTQTVGDIYVDLWNSVQVGDPVSVTLWKNQIRAVAANGHNESILDGRPLKRAEAALWPWIITVGTYALFLGILWNPRRSWG